MEVTEKSMYHYHRLGLYDDIWQLESEITIDDNFNSYCGSIVDKFSTAVKCKNAIAPLERIIDKYLDDIDIENIDLETTIDLLKASSIIITNANMYNRELMLEQYRKENNPKLPSRLHSIWLADKKSLKFWKKQLQVNRKLVLYKVSVTGNLFKSSDSFIPDEELTAKEMYEAASNYWNPIFKKEDLCKAEYLFQGKVKVLEKIK